MFEKLFSAAFLFGIGYGITFVAGWWFPWTSIVFGVFLLFATVVAIFDGNTRSSLGFTGIVVFALFGVLLFRSGRAELRSKAAITAEVERIDKQIVLAERTLADGKIDEAIRLCAELEPNVRNEQKKRLEQIKARAENEETLRPERIKEANERVSKLVSAAYRKVPNFNDVSDEAEQLLSEALSRPHKISH